MAHDDQCQRLESSCKFGQLGQKFRRQHKEVSKVCAVCGDRAMGYNFDAITCESCKAFFRRNALKDEDYHRCSFGNKCEINAVSRRFCQKCRLLKCFHVGMKKEWIENEEKLLQRKQKRIEKNKRKSSCPEMDAPPFHPLDSGMLRRKASSTGATCDRRCSRSSTDSNSDQGSVLKRSDSVIDYEESPKKMRFELELEVPNSCNGSAMRDTVIQRLPSIVPSTAPILLQRSPFVWPIGTTMNGSSFSFDAQSVIIPRTLLAELIRACQCCCEKANAPVPPVIHIAKSFL